MGHESFINWISPEIALAYFLAATVVLIGVLQIAGARWDRPELRWSRSRGASAFLGTGLILIATAAFYVGMRRLIFVPGLAGTELIAIFGVAALLATILVRVVARQLGHRAAAPAPSVPLAGVPRHGPQGLEAAGAAPDPPSSAALPDDVAWITPPPAGAAWLRRVNDAEDV
ncbi:MAG: hypothetical protein M5U01_30220 [Ardenticatenaceae bacterium]|nr:hypothetical protein [Ardenticatenaceae bacterium]